MPLKLPHFFPGARHLKRHGFRLRRRLGEAEAGVAGDVVAGAAAVDAQPREVGAAPAARQAPRVVAPLPVHLRALPCPDENRRKLAMLSKIWYTY